MHKIAEKLSDKSIKNKNANFVLYHAIISFSFLEAWLRLSLEEVDRKYRRWLLTYCSKRGRITC